MGLERTDSTNDHAYLNLYGAWYDLSIHGLIFVHFRLSSQSQQSRWCSMIPSGTSQPLNTRSMLEDNSQTNRRLLLLMYLRAPSLSRLKWSMPRAKHAYPDSCSSSLFCVHNSVIIDVVIVIILYACTIELMLMNIGLEQLLLRHNKQVDYRVWMIVYSDLQCNNLIQLNGHQCLMVWPLKWWLFIHGFALATKLNSVVMEWFKFELI